MINTSKLKGIIVEKGTSQEEVAEAIGINRATFYRKMKRGGVNFTIGEIQKMVEVIPLTNEEAMSIFFNTKVA
ncbi:helix-turn-helix domain-containing protein [Salinicoccus carnicancri]|uniref:helix-turn-helix domain-containing protein n=1 Tax=Salinicoccus carnicancri TaxID=558170 RepID=UPI0002F1226F|nr:helix-turn-helix transcriptional regulator [Salinicoccus carnicancri]